MRSCQMQYECAVWILKLYITSEFSGIKGFLHKTMRSISSNSLIVAFLDEMILYCHLYLARAVKFWHTKYTKESLTSLYCSCPGTDSQSLMFLEWTCPTFMYEQIDISHWAALGVHITMWRGKLIPLLKHPRPTWGSWKIFKASRIGSIYLHSTNLWRSCG